MVGVHHIEMGGTCHSWICLGPGDDDRQCTFWSSIAAAASRICGVEDGKALRSENWSRHRLRPHDGLEHGRSPLLWTAFIGPGRV